MDDDIEFFGAPQEAAPALILGKKKKKKKKPKNAEATPEGIISNGSADIDNGDAVPELNLGKKKKKSKTNAATPSVDAKVDSSNLFDSLMDANDDGKMPNDSNKQSIEDGMESLSINATAEEPAPPVPKKKKKKKKLVLGNIEDDQIDKLEAGAADVAEEKEPEKKKPLTAAEKKKAKKEREKAAKAAKKAKQEKSVEDIDAIIASLDAPSASSCAIVDNKDDHPIAATTAENGDNVDDLLGELDDSLNKAATKKKGKKKKGNPKPNEHVIDDLMNELESNKTKSTPAPDQSSRIGNEEVDDILAEFEESVSSSKPSAAQKKKAKKKKKAKASETEGKLDTTATDAGDAKKGKKKKESAAVRRVREQQEKRAAAEEAIRKQREEEERVRAEEERKLQEEQRKKDEERARKKAAEKARKERKRQDGTLLSKKEREKRQKAELYKQQLIAQGLLPMSQQGNDASAGGQSGTKGQRRVFGRSRRKRNVPGPAASHSSIASSETTVHAAVELEPTPVDAKVETVTVETDLTSPCDIKPAPEGVLGEPEVVPDDWEKEDKGIEHSADSAAQDKAENEEDYGSENDEDESSEEDSEDSDYRGMSKAEVMAEKRLDAIRQARSVERAKAHETRTPDHLRSPVICILGHVDTGKTKILDRIRRTNVQDGEAGGITQQIGATYFPIDAVKKETMKLDEGPTLSYNVPSLLIIDTPGHESFTNLRTRGSSLCDIAILVIDIMHGIEKQTLESINLLKQRKTPFIVALNKIDRMYDWKAQPNNCPSRKSLSKQKKHTKSEFEDRVEQTKRELMELGFNDAELYWKNNDARKSISLVPTSAITGEGIPDLLMLLLTLPQTLLTERLMFSSTLEATVLEVKAISGHGMTIDIILTGGTIHEGDTIMVVGLDGPIITSIRALLTPHPMKEMRVKGQYQRHSAIKAAQGIKISAEGLDKTVAGTQIVVVSDPDNEDEIAYAREEVMKDYTTILTNVDKSGVGVYVQASTLGSLEALLEFLRTSKIPVSGINIGPVHKRDVTKASTMLEKKKAYATILAFDVKVEPDAQVLADEVGVKIFTADIIYHLFDRFTKYIDDIKKKRREEVADEVVFPCICQIIPSFVFNKKDPIILGVEVVDGILRVGTPLVVQNPKGWLDIGRVASMENNKQQSVKIVKRGEQACLRIQHKNTGHIMFGRHFTAQDELVSKMSRRAIDLLKESFRNDLEPGDWKLVVKMKTMFNIQ